VEANNVVKAEHHIVEADIGISTRLDFWFGESREAVRTAVIEGVTQSGKVKATDVF
jgi:hypothetical protein